MEEYKDYWHYDTDTVEECSCRDKNIFTCIAAAIGCAWHIVKELIKG